ncbi:(d)CMP kinase [Candidatus Dojkabacteria bacterium]|nr:(d)CMP kinase [Candidatus Dojkabacteria bacterium]
MAEYYYQRPSDLKLLVVVGGPGGSGSSTISKYLAKKWGLHRVDAGEIMRSKTQKKELEAYLDNQVTQHPEIDKNIDQFLVRMSYYPNMLIEGKFFAAIATLVGIPCTVKIWITASLEVRVKRIMLREGFIKPEEKISKTNEIYIKEEKELLKRQESDISRAQNLYHADLSKPELFNDIVLDTTSLDVGRSIKKIMEEIANNDKLTERFTPEQLKF